uniref:kinetochore-associated protein NSL1 homolog isoform X1 n=1 Tax=Solea senegalensis TaxID=28829 RepID=UPI001CD82D3B|nr:kinetochore-associated protein NSL1 homolog isoform X1 [Solea senegalensis]
METVEREKSLKNETEQEYRVNVTSKKRLIEQMNKYKEVLKTALDGQTEMAEETKRVLLQELLANFEAAVQDNVLVNGEPWEEAPDEEDEEAYDLEGLLDDTIVETTRRRRTYPRQILPHVVHSLKAERKIMGLYEDTVKPQEMVKDPDQDNREELLPFKVARLKVSPSLKVTKISVLLLVVSAAASGQTSENIMTDLSAAAPGMVKQAIQVIKSISTLQKQAEGLCEILNMKPSHTTLEMEREVFGYSGQPDAPPPPEEGVAAERHRQPIKRAVEEAAATGCYVPLAKKPDCPAGGDKVE